LTQLFLKVEMKCFYCNRLIGDNESGLVVVPSEELISHVVCFCIATASKNQQGIRAKVVIPDHVCHMCGNRSIAKMGGIVYDGCICGKDTAGKWKCMQCMCKTYGIHERLVCPICNAGNVDEIIETWSGLKGDDACVDVFVENKPVDNKLASIDIDTSQDTFALIQSRTSVDDLIAIHAKRPFYTTAAKSLCVSYSDPTLLSPIEIMQKSMYTGEDMIRMGVTIDMMKLCWHKLFKKGGPFETIHFIRLGATFTRCLMLGLDIASIVESKMDADALHDIRFCYAGFKAAGGSTTQWNEIIANAGPSKFNFGKQGYF
jgi:hypothetical protein